MNQQTRTEACAYMRELFEILTAEDSASPSGEQEGLFRRLLDLEKRAQGKGADTASLAAIATARRTAGASVADIWPPRIRGH